MCIQYKYISRIPSPNKKNIYTSALDILKLDVYPNIFVLGKSSLQTIQGIKLEFEECPLQGECSGCEIPENQPMIPDKVDKLLEEGVVVESEHEPVEYISSIFLREKTNGT